MVLPQPEFNQPFEFLGTFSYGQRPQENKTTEGDLLGHWLQPVAVALSLQHSEILRQLCLALCHVLLK